MLTRRTILLAATSCIAACIATSRLANAGPGGGRRRLGTRLRLGDIQQLYVRQ
jgi:hypothetical protein